MADGRDDVATLLGPARLAYFTPVREYPPLGDRKAAVLLGANGLMVSVLLFFSRPIGRIVEGPRPWEARLVVTVLTPLVVLLLLGAWYAFRALTRPIPAMPPSLAYFPDIAALTREEYRRRILALDHRRAVRDMLHYNYSLAVLSVRRFRLVERSLFCSRATFELWILLLLMIAVFRRQ
jgi:Family of unknown function (DUF5706)